MQCPVCPDQVLTMADRQGVEIDYCPKCRGIWLDRGELDKLLEKAEAQVAAVAPAPAAAPAPAPAAAPRYDEPRYDDRRYDDRRYDDRGYGGGYSGKPYKKKKSILGEILDF